MLAGQIQLHVPEAVDVEAAGSDPLVADLGLGHVEPRERARLDRRPELLDRNARSRDARRPARRCPGRGRSPRRARARTRDSSPRGPRRSRRASRRPESAARCRARRRDVRRRSGARAPAARVPTPGSTTARCTPSGRYGSVFASTSDPCSTPCGWIPCVMSMISISGAIRFITPWHVPTKSSSSPKSVRKVTNTLSATLTPLDGGDEAVEVVRLGLGGDSEAGGLRRPRRLRADRDGRDVRAELGEGAGRRAGREHDEVAVRWRRRAARGACGRARRSRRRAPRPAAGERLRRPRRGRGPRAAETRRAARPATRPWERTRARRPARAASRPCPGPTAATFGSSPAARETSSRAPFGLVTITHS